MYSPAAWWSWLVFIGLLQPLVPFFDQICTRTLEFPMKCCQNYRDHWEMIINCLHHPFGVSIRKIIYTHQGRVCLCCWVVTTSCSVIWPADLYSNTRISNVVARTTPIIRKSSRLFTPSFWSIYWKTKIFICHGGVSLGRVVTASSSVVWQALCTLEL